MSQALRILDAAHGQCRLSVVSTTSLKLSQYGGQNLLINGFVQQIPAAGVTVSNTGLAASTLYYVYAAMVSGSMVLELSATGHSTATNGVETKTGDTSRTLVGMVYTNASTQFVDSVASPTCLNWFNRRQIAASAGALTGAVAATAFTEINTGLRVTFLAWSDEAVDVSVIGDMYGDTAGALLTLSPSLDTAQWGMGVSSSDTGTGLHRPATARAVAVVSEGKHVASAIGKTSAGNVQFSVGVQLITRG